MNNCAGFDKNMGKWKTELNSKSRLTSTVPKK